MKAKLTPINIETVQGMATVAHFLDAEHMSTQYPESFQIHSNFIRNNIPKNMYIKCRIRWNEDVNENAWVKVIDSKLGHDGKKIYTAALDDFNLGGVGSGAIAYDIEPKHIMDLDFQRFKKLFLN